MMITGENGRRANEGEDRNDNEMTMLESSPASPLGTVCEGKMLQEHMRKR